MHIPESETQPSRIENLTADDFEEKIDAHPIALVDFWAPWCPPCKAMHPILEKLSARLPDVFVGKVNVDEEQELAQGLEIKSLPTFVLFLNGQRVDTSMGAKPFDTMLRWIESHPLPKPAHE